MAEIQVLDKETINQIAAGEVIERPMSVVKELVENAVDAKASAITVEIENGGIDLIRVTDNGCGILPEEVRTAFLSHATSKIRSALDLKEIYSLGFRGEALSSIAAVSRVELITKRREKLLGVRYRISEGKEEGSEEVGAPEGSTFLVRNLFFNTPARRKFLKAPVTEAGYIHALLQRIALSHPEISFKFINGGHIALQTSGNEKVRDLIYRIYGRDIAGSLLSVSAETEDMKLTGFVGKPVVTRGNRNYENYFVNGRYVKSKLLQKGIEDAYHSYLMQHQYPFTVLSLTANGQEIDVNVHPQKLELRFQNGETVYEFIKNAVSEALRQKELIPEAVLSKKSPEKEALPKVSAPEPFEERRLDALREAIQKDSPYERKYPLRQKDAAKQQAPSEGPGNAGAGKNSALPEKRDTPEPLQETLPFFSEEARERFRIIGQAFRTYWIVEMGEKLFLIDQHAAHEKVIFERLMKRKAENREKGALSQQLSPPIMLSLSLSEEEALNHYRADFQGIGYEIEHFGGREYAVTAVPANIYGLNEQRLFVEMLDELVENGRLRDTEELYLRIATMSCKAAVKGGDALSLPEFEALLSELFTLENPYHCPHGRPTIISMSKYELERKFKRVI